MILFTLIFSLYEYMGGTETFTRDFYNSFVDGSLMIWFPAGRSYLSMVLFFLLYCCYCFFSLSLSRHRHKFSFVVDLRQIEFDWIIETITTIITKNWTFSDSLFFLHSANHRVFTYGCLCYWCIGKHAIRINNSSQTPLYYIQLAFHTNRKAK
jgi:hypothetical protein